MASDEVEGPVELPVVETIIPFQAKMHPDHIGRTTGGEGREILRFGEGMTEPDPIALPDGAGHGSVAGFCLLRILHLPYKGGMRDYFPFLGLSSLGKPYLAMVARA